METWLAECDPESEEGNTDVVREAPHSTVSPDTIRGVMRGCPQVEFACRQSTMLLQEFDEAVAKYQVPPLQQHGPLELL